MFNRKRLRGIELRLEETRKELYELRLAQATPPAPWEPDSNAVRTLTTLYNKIPQLEDKAERAEQLAMARMDGKKFFSHGEAVDELRHELKLFRSLSLEREEKFADMRGDVDRTSTALDGALAQLVIIGRQVNELIQRQKPKRRKRAPRKRGSGSVRRGS